MCYALMTPFESSISLQIDRVYIQDTGLLAEV